MEPRRLMSVDRLQQQVGKMLPPGGGDGHEPPKDTELHARVARLEATVATKADIADLRSDMHQATGNLRSELHKAVSDLIKWIVGTLFVAVALCVTLMTFVLNNATPKANPAPMAPIIIQMPGPAQPPVPDPSPRMP